MYREYKLKRLEMKNLIGKRMGLERHVDQRALEKFRTKPYQLQYAEKIKKRSE